MKLACLQQIRIRHRWLAIDKENDKIALAKKKGLIFTLQLFT
jgi:hypothetical protein